MNGYTLREATYKPGRHELAFYSPLVHGPFCNGPVHRRAVAMLGSRDMVVRASRSETACGGKVMDSRAHSKPERTHRDRDGSPSWNARERVFEIAAAGNGRSHRTTLDLPVQGFNPNQPW